MFASADPVSKEEYEDNLIKRGIINSPPKKSVELPRKFEVKHKTRDLVSSKQYNHSINGIKTCDDLVTFLKIESTLRNTKSDEENKMKKYKSVLGRLDKLQWVIMKKFLKQQIKIVTNKNSKKAKAKVLKCVKENIIKWVS